MILEIIFIILLSLILYNLFIYPILVYFLSFLLNKPTKKTKKHFKTSLIISAYNEEKVIKKKIINSLNLNYTDLEVILVCDGCTDNTLNIARKFKQIKIIELKKRQGKVNAIKQAIKEAKGEILIFSDANTFYEKNAIIQLNKHFYDNSVGCVTGNVRLIAKGDLKSGEGIYTKLEKFIQNNESKINSVIGIDGAMYALRRNLFPELYNFIIEDFMTGMHIIKLNYRVIYEKEAKAIEYSALNIKEDFKRRTRIIAGGFQSLFHLNFLLKKPLILFFFISHKLLRWILAEILILLFIINLFLINSIYFQIFLLLQIIFYLSSFIVNVVKYFVIMQIASILGLFKFIFKIQTVKWNKTKRL